jgi:hypothetical protein
VASAESKEIEEIGKPAEEPGLAPLRANYFVEAQYPKTADRCL